MKTYSVLRALTAVLVIFGTRFVGAVQEINTPAWESHYRIYPSTEEARVAYARDIEPAVARYSQKEGPRPIIPSGDPRYATAEKTVESVFLQFQKLQPDRLGKLPAPPVVLVEDSVTNAYAVSAAIANDALIPYLFVIQTGLLDQGLSEDAIHGIVAHELAHLLFRHTSPDVGEKLKKYYTVSGSEARTLGFLQHNDDRLERRMLLWLSHAQDVGPTSSARLNEAPLSLTPGFDLTRALEYLIENFTKDEDCKKRTMGALMVLRLNALSTFDEFTMRFDLGADGLDVFDESSQRLRDTAAACATDGKIAFRDLYEGFSGLKIDLILAQATSFQKKQFAREEKIFAAGENAFDALFRLIKAKRLEMSAIEKTVDLKKVRVYATEEEADDASVQVMTMLGRDPAGIAQFFARLLSKEDQAKCKAIIKSGKAPSYGDLTFPHHSHCYRIYHVKLVAHKLKGKPWKRALGDISRAVK